MMGKPKDSSDNESKREDAKNLTALINKKRSAVVQAINHLEQEARHVCSMTPQPFVNRPYSVAEDQAESLFLTLLAELQPLVRNRLYFSAKLEYVYASQMAKFSTRTSSSGESLGRIEHRLTEALKHREECLGARDEIIKSLTDQLNRLHHTGSQAVLSCKTSAYKEYEEVKESSENNLESLKESLAENRRTMRSHELRDEEDELHLRKTRQDLEGEIMHKIREYDATMSSLQTTLDGLREEDKNLALLLQKKRVEFNDMERRYEEIEAEKRRIEEARMAAIQAEFRREYAAKTIQRAWQHYKMRKMLKKAQKKKKKKPKDK